MLFRRVTNVFVLRTKMISISIHHIWLWSLSSCDAHLLISLHQGLHWKITTH